MLTKVHSLARLALVGGGEMLAQTQPFNTLDP
jgi:hypothetical protein